MVVRAWLTVCAQYSQTSCGFITSFSKRDSMAALFELQQNLLLFIIIINYERKRRPKWFLHSTFSFFLAFTNAFSSVWTVLGFYLYIQGHPALACFWNNAHMQVRCVFPLVFAVWASICLPLTCSSPRKLSRVCALTLWVMHTLLVSGLHTRDLSHASVFVIHTV